ncbi:hypothetical protein ADUPG1_013288 [Aduncisulcus paluster]|uniref:RRM domain-containing protein n=1 Tax=Aduncisulcus paluster TaxID=2918883 RepID=A0ABQ5K2F3_9EUKA|nr:hypothetical protein ADUPG1_013288 [Aduncisulcus paluster]|eukprot:gnl/Carplike_NY0171/1000_a1375_1804.p1 GENE.gnl/Carplike_NY0171/1000_a1375_1804~~gnl/Carplike_NY0171/1000_a1375_1804.p1  ORF type:complete len:211 (-),score=65.22 gnl/Carplike_NY0171/1000_a1375_1804:31-663(-)
MLMEIGSSSLKETVKVSLLSKFQRAMLEKRQEDEEESVSTRIGIECAYCGGSHYAKDCPNKELEDLYTELEELEKCDGIPEKYLHEVQEEDVQKKTYRAPGRGSTSSKYGDDFPTLFLDIPPHLDEKRLQQILQDAGKGETFPSRGVKIIYDRETGESRGRAFISFDTPFAADKMMELGNGFVVEEDRFVLRLEVAKGRKRRTQRGGAYK